MFFLKPFRCCLTSDNDDSGKSHTTNSKGSSVGPIASDLTKIFEELKCPVCFNVCVPPIHNCINGHITCNNCRKKGNVTSCPTCREALNGARNYFAENFVLNYAQQCRYGSQGCEHLRLKGCNMKPHEEKCMFRPLRCIVASCRHEIPYKNFLAHLDCAHKISGTDALPAIVQHKYYPAERFETKTRWLPYSIQAFGNIYYIMMERIRGNTWIWAYVQASKESDDMEYSHLVSFKLKHPHKKITQSWNGPVYPIRTPIKSIMSEGCCFMVSEMILKNFVSSQGVLSFTVDIRKSTRRSLKGVKLSGDDSETTVAPTFPGEYDRPPSIYEPTAPTESFPTDSQPLLDENGNIIECSPPPTKPAKQQSRVRTPAIGILRNNPQVQPGARCRSVTSTSRDREAHKNFKVEDEFSDREYLDKIPSQTVSILKTRSSMKVR